MSAYCVSVLAVLVAVGALAVSILSLCHTKRESEKNTHAVDRANRLAEEELNAAVRPFLELTGGMICGQSTLRTRVKDLRKIFISTLKRLTATIQKIET